jgi:3-oxoacyl-[acyl-carrier-protein] synthase-3
MACRKVIESSGVDPNRIGIICNTSVWRDYLEPGMAVCIHHELGLPGVIRV